MQYFLFTIQAGHDSKLNIDKVFEKKDSVNCVFFFKDHIGTIARTLKQTVTKNVLKEKLKSTTNLLHRLRLLAEEVNTYPKIIHTLVNLSAFRSNI